MTEDYGTPSQQEHDCAAERKQAATDEVARKIGVVMAVGIAGGASIVIIAICIWLSSLLLDVVFG